MSLAKIQKYISRLAVNTQTSSEISEQTRPVILLTDSKGFMLREQDFNSDITIDCIIKSGRSTQDSDILEALFDRFQELQPEASPIVFIWLSTCDLTYKRGKFVYLKRNLNSR